MANFQVLYLIVNSISSFLLAFLPILSLFFIEEESISICLPRLSVDNFFLFFH